MRTATAVLVAVLTAATAGTRALAHAPLPLGEIAPMPGLRGAHPAPVCSAVMIAEDGANADPVTAERLGGGLPASGTTAEIPPAPPAPGEQLDPQPAPDASSADPQATGDPNLTPDPQDPQTDDAVQADVPPHVYSLQDFVNQGLDESPLGVELREDCSRLKSHEKVCGLAVLEVRNGSPADKAGIKRYTALTHDLLDGASVAAALVFPPAIVAVAVIDQSGIGESFDLVIGVDGRRVRHILDFQDLTANVRPGDILYLTVVRAGKRMQIPVHVPPDTTTARN
jgi:hypothetical protein